MKKTKKFEMYSEINEDLLSKFTEFKNSLNDNDPFDVRISSEGGSALVGILLYNLIKQHKGLVRTFNDGMVISAASLPLLAGKERYTAKSSITMIHDPYIDVVFNVTQKDLLKHFTNLETLKNEVKKIYLTELKLTETDLSKIMDQETLLDPSMSIKLGFYSSTLNMKSKLLSVKSSLKSKLSSSIKTAIKNMTKQKNSIQSKISKILSD